MYFTSVCCTQDNIASLKAKMSQNSRESEERNRDLREQREVIAQHFHELKSQMNNFRENERSRLTKLTLESNASIKEVKRKLDMVSCINIYISLFFFYYCYYYYLVWHHLCLGGEKVN